MLKELQILVEAERIEKEEVKLQLKEVNLAGNYMFKVNNRNTRTRCEICSKLTMKTSEWL